MVRPLWFGCATILRILHKMSEHEITIKNFTSGETIEHPVIIIKGIIKNKKCQKTQNEIFTNINSSTNLFKVVDNQFKVLTELNDGINSITLKYCCSSMTFTLCYSQRVTASFIMPLYIICDGHDGRFQAPNSEPNDVESACKRIDLASKLLQCVMAEKLYEGNFGRKTFQLRDCKIFNSKLSYVDARKMTQEELWNYLGREIVNSELDSDNTKFLGFLSCSRYCGEKYSDDFTHSDIIKITEGYVALGGGGFALFGTACLYTWPENISSVIENFENSTPVDRKKFMDDSCYRGTLGACFSTTLGSVLHELCHTFDLGHTKEGIMARGFDDIYKVFVSPEERKMSDGIFWTRSCLVFLAHHKWMNNFTCQENKIIKFDPVTKFLSSTAGLRVVELRDEDNGMVLFDWVFDGRVLKYSFQIPGEVFETFNQNCMLIVENNVGNIFKHSIKIN